jgi:PAS domain S-box-containing protein
LNLAHYAVIVREPSDSRVTFWNREAEAVYGYSAAEAMGRVTHELLATVFPDTREAVAGALGRDGQWSGELRHRCKDGSEILVASRQALQRDADGRALAIIELNSDITLQRRAGAELRASRERLAEAERVGGLGSWEEDLTTGRVTYSDGMLALYGISAGQFAGTVAASNALMYPEDRDLFRIQFKQAVDERSSFLIDYRVIRADGRVRTLRSRGDIVVDDDGQPVRAIGIVQDITDAKLTQAALQSTSAELGRRASELQQLAQRSADGPPSGPYAPLSARQLGQDQLQQPRRSACPRPRWGTVTQNAAHHHSSSESERRPPQKPDRDTAHTGANTKRRSDSAVRWCAR